METKGSVERTVISCNFSHYSKGAFIQIFLFLIFMCTASAYAQTKEKQFKAEYLARKVPHDHDFAKIKEGASYRPNHLIVRFAPDSNGSQRPVGEKQNVIKALGGGTFKRSLNASKGSYLIELPDNLTVEEALEIYNARDDVLYAEPDYKVKGFATIPNDPLFSYLWGMHNAGQSGGTIDADIDAPEVWDIKTNAENIIVAVIDTGVDYNHEDLHQNMWTNEAELNGSPGVDDDGNGYIDDIYGYDFAYDDSDPMDGHSHGTHCAGIIGAVGNNGVGVAGVCWNVKIMAVKFLDDSGSGGEGWISDAVLSIQYAQKMGAKVMSNSWGWAGSYIQDIKDAIDDAGEAGILFIAAAGNDGTNNDLYPHYPASYTSDNIISVMATDRNDVRSIWPEYNKSSCYGATSVDIAAPGTDILSCVPGGNHDQYASFDGTSMATPHVTGACALVWSMDPSMSYTQVKDKILDSADRLDSLDGLCVTEARLNVFQAIPLEMTITDDVADGDCRGIDEEIVYTIQWSNPTGQTFTNAYIIDLLPAGITVDEESLTAPFSPATADPNIIYGIKDANDLDEITLPVGQSVRLYLTKETVDEDVFLFYLEADISDPNLGWIDNTEYDPNNPGTAEILASPRASFFDYYGPGYTQPEGIQFMAANLGGAIQDGNLASFVYTATQPGYVVLTLVDYDAIPATLEEIVIRQTDPNDPNYVPQEPNEPPAYPAFPASGEYDPNMRTVTWPLGTINPNDSGSVQLTVYVNEKSEPGMEFTNAAQLHANGTMIASAAEDTLVCCWDTTDPNVIFVDKNANGNNNGTSWSDAYNDLQDALYRAENSTCENIDTIYAAQGTYKPGFFEFSTFKLLDGMFLFGGFPTGGCDFSQRNPKQYETILTGRIDETRRLDTVVTIGGNNALLSGFTITEAAEYGVYGSGVDFTIENSTIEKSDNYGIYAANGNVAMKWCYVKNNKLDGVRHQGAEFTLNVENCWIMKNLQQGIFCLNSTPTVKNSIVSESDLSEAGSAGILTVNPTYPPVLHNCTFAHNRSVGVFFADNHDATGDPNILDYPDLQNCILWLNNNAGAQFTGFSKEYIYHSCIYDPNDPNGVDLTPDVNYNFSANPKFAYLDPNNVHIQYDSPCKDAGNQLMSYDEQEDMDHKARVAGAAVDVGAYEVDCQDTFHPLDWNADGRINLFEFNYFSKAWLTYDPNNPLCDPNNPGYVGDPNAPGYISQLDKERFNPACDLDSDLDVDLGDLIAFCEDDPQIWGWKACWMTEEYLSAMMADGQQQMQALNIAEQTPVLNNVEQIPVLNIEVLVPEVVQPVPEPNVQPEISVEEQIAQLQDAIEFLEQIWSEDPNMPQEIGADEWQQFMEAVSQSLSELQTEAVQIK